MHHTPRSSSSSFSTTIIIIIIIIIITTTIVFFCRPPDFFNLHSPQDPQNALRVFEGSVSSGSDACWDLPSRNALGVKPRKVTPKKLLKGPHLIAAIAIHFHQSKPASLVRGIFHPPSRLLMRKHCFQRSVVLQDSLDSHQSACFCPRPLEEESKRRSASQKKKANLCLRIGVEDLLMSSPSWGKRTVHTRSSGDQSYRKMANLWLPIDPYFFHDLRSYYSSTASWLLSMWLLYAFV